MEMDINAESIRKLRGSLSRKDFSKRIGVTELTVYRWELPDGAPEARRPRGKVLASLMREFPEGARGAPDAAENAVLLPLQEQFLRGAWKRCEEQLLGLLVSDQLRSEGARALAAA